MSPVVATILLVALVILLASILTTGLMFLDTDFEMPSFASDTESDTGSGLIYALDDSPEKSSVRHRAEFPIPPGSSLDGDSLNSVEIEYLNGSVALAQDERSDIKRIGIDNDGDGKIDTDVYSDVEDPSNGGVDVREGEISSASNSAATTTSTAETG
ncbi:hypothetical protein ACFQJD_09630 [Haloplanus sp. GCM10025708]|uniref:hypothetical protein n=1 Tax=Haloplanus sp. GCM10025708 TaxID=3252679 RepID=UPI003613466A